MKRRDFATIAAHAALGRSEPDFTPTCAPVHRSVTYWYDRMSTLDAVLSGQCPGYVYSRLANPTVSTLESTIARLESTESAVACGSGMAAIHLAMLSAGMVPGSVLLAARDLYGGTLALLRQVLAQQGVRIHSVDTADRNAVARTIAEIKPTAVLAETISNPLLGITDVPVLVQLAHQAGSVVIVDNTFATPYLYQPALHGADYVVESATKYLGGHGDVMGGIVAGSKEACLRARQYLELVGGLLGPDEAWLILRGLKTLAVRMRQHCQNAAAVARFLSYHPSVERVYYPGLPTHPQFQLSRRVFAKNMYGGVVSFELRCADQEDVFRFMEALELVIPGTSLGDVTSLILYPAHSSHRSLTEAQRQQAGISRRLVRLSVGIEEPSDIIYDLAQALDVMTK
jgi:cystathionine beta-lyase/cystathionine gamma-synthase